MRTISIFAALAALAGCGQFQSDQAKTKDDSNAFVDIPDCINGNGAGEKFVKNDYIFVIDGPAFQNSKEILDRLTKNELLFSNVTISEQETALIALIQINPKISDDAKSRGSAIFELMELAALPQSVLSCNYLQKL